MVGLNIDHVDRVNAFVAANAFTEPVIKAFSAKENGGKLEGSTVEAAMEYAVMACLMSGLLENLEPASFGLVHDDELIAVALGSGD